MFTKCVEAKHAAMTSEANEFYSRYPHQSWKNILSLGDSRYEYQAVKRLGAIHRAMGGRERHLRSKAVRLQSSPSVRHLTLQCRLLDKLMPTLVRFDGSVSLDLQASNDALQDLALALRLPGLAELHPLRHVWDAMLPAPLAWNASYEEEFALSLRKVQLMCSSQPHSFSSTSTAFVGLG